MSIRAECVMLNKGLIGQPFSSVDVARRMNHMRKTFRPTAR